MEIVVYTETKPYRYAQVVGRERGEKDAPPRFFLEGLSRRILVTHRCFIAQIASCPTNETPPTAADVKVCEMVIRSRFLVLGLSTVGW